MQPSYGLSAVCQALLFTEVNRVERALCGQAGDMLFAEPLAVALSRVPLVIAQ